MNQIKQQIHSYGKSRMEVRLSNLNSIKCSIQLDVSIKIDGMMIALQQSIVMMAFLLHAQCIAVRHRFVAAFW